MLHRSPLPTDTESLTPSGRRSLSLKIATGYLLTGLIWVWVSDAILYVAETQTIAGFLISGGKGSLFFLLTSPALFWLVRSNLQSLAHMNELLTEVTEGTTDAVYVKDKEGRYLLFNSASSRLVGKPVSDVLGQKDESLFEPESVALIQQTDCRVMESGEVVTSEDRLKAAGVERVYLTTKAPLRDVARAVVGVVGISRDITDRVRAEASLRDREQLLAVVTDAARVGLVVVGTGYEYLFANAAYAEVLGLQVAEIVGRRVPDLLPSGWDQIRPRLDRALAGESQAYELTLQPSKEVPARRIRVMYEPRRDSRGQVTVVVVVIDVTVNYQVEDALRAERDRFEKLVETAPAVICTFLQRPDGTMCFPYASRKIEEIYGISRELLAHDATPVFALIHPDDIEPMRIAIEVSARDLTVWHIEFRIAHPTRGEVWVEGKSAPIRQPDGSTIWHGHISDVTARKLAERKLGEQELLVREAAEMAHVGGWGFDPVTMESDWTPVVARIYGLDPNGPPTVGAALEFFSPEQRPALEAALAASVRDGTPHDLELLLTSAKGEKRWVRSICHPIVEGGRVVRVRGSLQDVTDRKQAEATLRESEWRFRQLFEHTPSGIGILDASGRFLQCNPAYCAILGRSEEELQSTNLVDLVHADDWAENLALLQGLAAGEIPLYQLENRFLHKSGETRWVHNWVTALSSQSGKATHLMALVTDVTDRRRVELELRKGEERLRLAVKAANIGLWDWDMLAQRTHYSQEWKALLGYTPDEISDTFNEWESRVHPDDLTRIMQIVHRILASTESTLGYEYRMHHKDGSWRWIYSRAEILRDDNGTPLRMLGGNIDVTDRKSAVEGLRASEERYRRLIEVLPEAVFINADDRVSYCNPACVALFGAPNAAALVGKPPLDLFAPEFHDRIRARIQELHTTGNPAPGLDERIIRLDGRVAPAHVVATPITDGGRPAILVCLRDLSERERTLGLLRNVLGSVNDAILTIDTRGVIESVNPATERMFGFSEPELLGHNVQVLMPEPDRSKHDGYIADYLRTGTAKVIGTGREVDGRRKNGSTFPIEMTISEFRLDGERRFTGVLRDITARRKLEEQFRQSQKMEAIGRLAGGVAHDFNNLLTVINGYSDLLLYQLPSDSPQRAPLSAVRDAGERAAALTSQLLAFSRKAIVAPKVFDMNDVATQSERLLRRLIGEDIVLTLILHPNACRVKADPNQIDQVILNLAVNARDAMPNGGRLSLETRPYYVAEGSTSLSQVGLRPGHYIELKVSDTGCGMPPEVQARIFEPFFTTKGEGKGTGLGLATVFGIVHQAGGNVSVHSEVGHGTTFRILLPSVDAAVVPADVVQPATGRGSEMVLLVEDDDAVRTLSTITLESLGYTVLAAANGTTALNLLHSGKAGAARVLVTDVVMPEMSGRELADSVRSAFPDLRVLFVSGYTNDEVFRHGIKEATDAFLQKPFSPMGLARKVRELLDAR